MMMGRALGFAAAMAMLTPAAAQAAGRCSIGSLTSGTASAEYDPFAAAATMINVNGVQMIRVRGTANEITTAITFYVKARSPGLDGAQLRVTQATGLGTPANLNQNILVASNGVPPALVNGPAAPTAGTFRWTFQNIGAGANMFSLNFQFQLPPGLNAAAASSQVFDIHYSCTARDGPTTVTDTGTLNAALGLNITIRNALQAYFNGQASANTLSFDFGEIGQTTSATVTGAPVTYTRSGFVNVRSSGAYSVSLSSPNAFRMTYPGGNPATPAQSLTYSVTMLGQTRSGTSGSGAAVPAITRNCQRGGVPAPGAQLPLSVTLTEGGTTKNPAPVYRDEMTITIAPIVATNLGGCP